MEALKKNCTILHVEAFNSEKKRSGVSISSKADNTIYVHWKGAAEIILAMCLSYYNAYGSTNDMDDDERTIFEQIEEFEGKKTLEESRHSSYFCNERNRK